MEPIKYVPAYARLIAAFVATFLLIFNKCWHCISDSLLAPGMYLVFSLSFLMAYGILYYIHYITVRFDERYDWWEHKFGRAWLQILVGVSVPLTIDFIVMKTYLTGTEQLTDYNKFLGDFPIIVLSIILVNLYYFSHYVFVRWRRAEKKRSQADEKIPVVSIRRTGLNVDIPLAHILFVHVWDRKTYIRTQSGEEYPTGDTLKSAQKRVEKFGFFQISKSVLINPVIVKGYVKGANKYLKRIILKPEFKGCIPANERDKLDVTRAWIPLLRVLYGSELKESEENSE